MKLEKRKTLAFRLNDEIIYGTKSHGKPIISVRIRKWGKINDEIQTKL